MSQIQLWDPFKELEAMQNRMAGWFTGTGSAKDVNMRSFYPSIDISEDKEAYLFKAELPDVKKEDIKVECHEGVLTISGEKKFEKESKDESKRYHRIERSYGTFMRSFTLPETADSEHIHAEFQNGLLNVKIAKKALPAPKARTVLVK